MPDGGRETRVRVKAGYFAGREGVLVHEERGNDPDLMKVEFDTGPYLYINLGFLEFLPEAEPDPEPARDIPAVLAGIGRWQQQDPRGRRIHFQAEPIVAGNILGHAVTVHIVASRGAEQAGFDTWSITISAPASEAEVMAALDRLVAQPPGTSARLTTEDAEALATHAAEAP